MNAQASVATAISGTVFDRGAAKFAWWPDWRGRAVALVAAGPSANKAGVEQLRGRMLVFAIKQGIDLAPWADAVYGCDKPWWEHKRGLPKFGGLKLAWEQEPPGALYPDVRPIIIGHKKDDQLRLDEPCVIGSGGNSGFQALNLALQFGASRLLLIGFDFSDRSGAHYYGRNGWPMANNPTADNFRRWLQSLTANAGELQRLGVDVINAAPFSALQCFRKRSVAEAIAEWG